MTDLISSKVCLGFHLNEVKISPWLATISLNRQKKEITFRQRTDLLSLSVYNKALGLTHSAFEQSNAMLALLSSCKFSAKDTTLFRRGFFEAMTHPSHSRLLSPRNTRLGKLLACRRASIIALLGCQSGAKTIINRFHWIAD